MICVAIWPEVVGIMGQMLKLILSKPAIWINKFTSEEFCSELWVLKKKRKPLLFLLGNDLSIMEVCLKA